MLNIAIIGGGPGGLLTARLLQGKVKNECRITIYEAASRLGGKIRTENFKTFPIQYEAGLAEIYDYSPRSIDPLMSFIKGSNLTLRQMSSGSSILENTVAKNKADIKKILGKDAIRSIRNFCNRCTSILSRKKYSQFNVKAENAHPWARTLFQVQLDSISNPKARKYIATLCHSDLATEPHQTSALNGLKNFLMNEPGYVRLHRVEGGNEKIVDELLLGMDKSDIKLNHRVVKIVNDRDRTYQVSCNSDGNMLTYEHDVIICALPLHALAAIEFSSKKICQAVIRHVAHYDHPAHFLRVTLLFESPFWKKQLKGSYFLSDTFGGCCIYDESKKYDGKNFGVLAWLLAGNDALYLSNQTDDVITEQIIDSLPPFLRKEAGQLLESRIHRWLGAINGIPGGSPVLPLEQSHIPDSTHPNFLLVGDYFFDSTLNGVAESANFVVTTISKRVKNSI